MPCLLGGGIGAKGLGEQASIAGLATAIQGLLCCCVWPRLYRGQDGGLCIGTMAPAWSTALAGHSIAIRRYHRSER